MDAGIIEKLSDNLISFKKSETDYAVPLHKKLVWSSAGTKNRVFDEDSNYLGEEEDYLVTTTNPYAYNGFCAENINQTMSGTYHYNLTVKTITFKLKMDLEMMRGLLLSPVEYIGLALSEDETLGDDLMISCNINPHISAFGHWKVIN